MAIVTKLLIAAALAVAAEAAAASLACEGEDLLGQCPSSSSALADENSALQVSADLTKRAGTAQQQDSGIETAPAGPPSQPQPEREAQPAKLQARSQPQSQPEKELAAATAATARAAAARATPKVAIAGRKDAAHGAPPAAALMATAMALRAEGERAAAASLAARKELVASAAASKHEPEVLATAAAGVAAEWYAPAPVALSLAQAAVQRQGTGTVTRDITLSVSNIIMIAAIVCIIFFALVLYHNNYNVQATVNQIKENPGSAYQDAKTEVGNLYERGVAKGSGKGQTFQAPTMPTFSQANMPWSQGAPGSGSDPFTSFYSEGRSPRSQKSCC